MKEREREREREGGRERENVSEQGTPEKRTQASCGGNR